MVPVAFGLPALVKLAAKDSFLKKGVAMSEQPRKLSEIMKEMAEALLRDRC